MLIYKIICKFAADFEIVNLNNALYMNPFMKYLGVVLLILGVVCLVVYRFAMPHNALLVSGIVLEVAGILAYIFINKKLN